MTDAKILIVQNDQSAATRLEERLIAQGYTVCAAVSSAQQAIEKAADMHPDLALIGLGEDTDGVEVAEQIGTQMPVIYLMDEIEEDLLQRAEATQPFGYVIDPVDERQLHLNIQTALSQYKKERKHRETEREMDQKINELQHQAQRMETILDSISDGVIAADENGDYLIFNSSAKRIVGTYNPGTDLNHRSEEYGLFFPDRVTLFPSEDLPLARAIRGESTDDVEVFVSNPNLPNGKYISISGSPLQPDKSGVKGGVIVFRDISKDKEAEAKLEQAVGELRDQTHLMETVLENINNGVVLSTATDRILFMNSSAKKIIGIDNTDVLMDIPANERSETYGIFYPDGKTHVPTDHLPLVRAVKGEETEEMGLLFRNEQNADGTYVRIRGIPVLDRDGKVIKAGMAILRDFTEHKSLEDRLAQIYGEPLNQRPSIESVSNNSEITDDVPDIAEKREMENGSDQKIIEGLREKLQLMEAICDNLNDGIIVANPAGQILFANKTTESIFGRWILDPDARDWSKTFGIYYPDIKTHIPIEQLPLTRALYGEETEEMEVFIRNQKNTEGTYISARGRPILSSDETEIVAGLVVLRDITQKRETDAKLEQTVSELRDQTQLLETVFDNMSEGLVVADKTGELVLYNASAEQIFGMKDVHVEPDKWSETYGIFYPDGKTLLPIEQYPLIRAMQGESIDEMEFFVRNENRPQGTHISASARPLMSSDKSEIVASVGIIRNITKRKTAEAKLEQAMREQRSQAQLLETIFNSISDGVIVADAEGAFTIFNPSAEQIVGIGMLDTPPEQWTEQYGIFLPDKKTHLPTDQIPLVRAINGQNTDNLELFIRNEGKPDGVHISVSGRPLQRDIDGHGGGVVVFHDITARKKAEARLEQTNRELRHQTQLMETVFNSISDGVIVVNAEGLFTVYNPSAEQIYGIGALDIPSDQWTDRYGIFLSDEKTPAPTDQLPLVRAINGQNTDNLELFIRNEARPDGVYISASSRPLQRDIDGHGGGVVVFHDITARKKAEAKLEQTNRKLRHQTQLMETAFNSISDGIAIADTSDRSLYVTPSAVQMTGIDGMNTSLLEWSRKNGVFYPDQKTLIKGRELPFIRILYRGESIDDEDIFIRNEKKPDGVYVRLSGRPLRNDHGMIRGCVVIFRDVTEQMINEEALRQAFAQGRLEVVDTILHNIGNAINSVTTGIDTIYRRLSDDLVSRRLSALAQAVEAHRENWVDYIQNDPQGQQVLPFVIALAEDLNQQNANMVKTVDRVNERTKHISDIIRTQKTLGGLHVVRKDIDLRNAIYSAIKVLQESLDNRGIKITVNCENAPREIRIQESQFHQMMINLIKNSMEAIDDLTVKDGLPETPRILVHAYMERNFLNIDVNDNGIGISQENAKKIFSAGYTTKKEGSGLGLHSAANFVISSGGQIQPLSDGIGRGTTMRIMLRLTSIMLPRESGGGGGEHLTSEQKQPGSNI